MKTAPSVHVRPVGRALAAKAALTGALAAALVALAAPAHAVQFECYDFSNLPEGSQYTVGDSVDARHSTATIKQYFTNGNPAKADARKALVQRSQIAGGSAPELALYLVSVEVRPNQPITHMRVKVAQSISQTGAFANANIAVNGERHESPNGFAGMNGHTIGRPGKGRVQITSSMAPVGDGNWQRGTLELRAVSGHIESILLGGHSWHLDDYCIAR